MVIGLSNDICGLGKSLRTVYVHILDRLSTGPLSLEKRLLSRGVCHRVLVAPSARRPTEGSEEVNRGIFVFRLSM